MLTARDSAADTLHGLEGGADDYMSKPYRFDELLARVRLRLKAGHPRPVGALQVGGLELDLLTRRINVDGEWHDLSAREFALAEEFIRQFGAGRDEPGPATLDAGAVVVVTRDDSYLSLGDVEILMA